MCLTIRRYPCQFPLWILLFEESIHYLHVVYCTELKEFRSACIHVSPSEFTNGATPGVTVSANLCVKSSAMTIMSCVLKSVYYLLKLFMKCVNVFLCSSCIILTMTCKWRRNTATPFQRRQQAGMTVTLSNLVKNLANINLYDINWYLNVFIVLLFRITLSLLQLTAFSIRCQNF